jgi:hypothetical protein
MVRETSIEKIKMVYEHRYGELKAQRMPFDAPVSWPCNAVGYLLDQIARRDRALKILASAIEEALHERYSDDPTISESYDRDHFVISMKEAREQFI